MIERDFDGIRLDISCKDLELEAALGRSLSVPLFLHGVCTQIYEMGRAAGFGSQDATAIVKVYEQLTGTTVGNESG
jgi:3-hydroxyisobutyrate dehydrogenase-like beta-hydroxyacid dehydrogenase